MITMMLRGFKFTLFILFLSNPLISSPLSNDTLNIAIKRQLAQIEAKITEKDENELNSTTILACVAIGTALLSFWSGFINTKITVKHSDESLDKSLKQAKIASDKSLLHTNRSVFRIKLTEQLREYLSTYITYSLVLLHEGKAKLDGPLTENQIKREQAKHQLLFFLRDDGENGPKREMIRMIKYFDSLESVDEFNDVLYNNFFFQARNEIGKQWSKMQEEIINDLETDFKPNGYTEKDIYKESFNRPPNT